MQDVFIVSSFSYRISVACASWTRNYWKCKPNSRDGIWIFSSPKKLQFRVYDTKCLDWKMEHSLFALQHVNHIHFNAIFCCFLFSNSVVVALNNRVNGSATAHSHLYFYLLSSTTISVNENDNNCESLPGEINMYAYDVPLPCYVPQLFSLFRQGWRSNVIVRSFRLSLCHYVSRITHKCGNGRQPNVVGMGKRWPRRDHAPD